MLLILGPKGDVDEGSEKRESLLFLIFIFSIYLFDCTRSCLQHVDLVPNRDRARAPCLGSAQS